MTDKIIELKKTTFKNEFYKYLDLVPEQHQNMAKEYIEELDFMRGVMDNLKEEIAKMGATGVFQNGAQTNTRQTPELKAYLDVTNRYNQYMKQLLALYPTAQQQATDELSAFLESGK